MLVLDLPGANLPETNRRGAHLPGARFHRANLTDAHLEGATLLGADMAAYIGELEVDGTDLLATKNLPPGRGRYITDERTLFPPR